MLSWIKRWKEKRADRKYRIYMLVKGEDGSFIIKMKSRYWDTYEILNTFTDLRNANLYYEHLIASERALSYQMGEDKLRQTQKYIILQKNKFE